MKETKGRKEQACVGSVLRGVGYEEVGKHTFLPQLVGDVYFPSGAEAEGEARDGGLQGGVQCRGEGVWRFRWVSEKVSHGGLQVEQDQG